MTDENMIDKEVPMPASPHSRVTPKYPFDDMEKGDSFLVEWEEDVRDGIIKTRLYAAVSRANKRLEGRKFSQRTVQEGVRVWRVS